MTIAQEIERLRATLIRTVKSAALTTLIMLFILVTSAACQEMIPIALDRGEKQSQFNSEGFPENICKAFQFTADATGMIILSRVPGGNCNRLIDEGYDQKGFFIKSKSCNWGPMSGFVCQIPHFNKQGSAGVAFNAAKTDAFWRHFQSFQKFVAQNPNSADGDPREHAVTEESAVVPFASALTPFVQLKVSDARKQELLSSGRTGNVNGILYHKEFREAHGTVVFGIAQPRDQSILMEFFLVKESENLWAVYHGEIFQVDNDKRVWVDFLEAGNTSENFPYFNDAKRTGELTRSNRNGLTNRMVLLELYAQIATQQNQPGSCRTLELIRPRQMPEVKAVQKKMQQKAGVVGRSRLPFSPGHKATLYPILGIKNQYPAYAFLGGRATANVSNGVANTDFYKNAVTGDYDLMSVWPYKTINSDELDLVRRSEGKSKRFTIHTGGVMVEVIPSFAELESKLASEVNEDSLIGNLSDNVIDVAQHLNSAISGIRGESAVNIAFHGDEGGRPGVTDLDLPIAVFLPRKIGTAQEPDSVQSIDSYCRTMIRSRQQFIELAIRAKASNFQVLCNAGWLYDMVKQAQTDRTQSAILSLFGMDRLPDSNGLETIRQHLRGTRNTPGGAAKDVVTIKEILGIR